MTLYRTLDYIDALSYIVEARKKSSKKFTYIRLAESIGVHRPYLSRVLKKQADLSEDQWFDLLHYLELDEDEMRYLTLIHQYTRSSNGKRKKILLVKIKEIQKNKRDSKKELKAQIQDPKHNSNNESLSEYYLNPNLQIIHFYFTIPEVQKKPSLICEKWKISLDDLNIGIKKLTDLGFIEYKQKEKKYAVLMDHMHLDSEHFLTKYSQNMMRLKSLEQVSYLNRKHCYNFSITVSVDNESVELLQDNFMKFLKESEKAVRKSKPKRVYQLNFDLFPWETK
jgi:uncharacterized protein (TIGR02147 family)